MIDGLKFTNDYVEGGIFSLDGVHPPARGRQLIANQFIKVINSKFGGNSSNKCIHNSRIINIC